MWSPEAAPSTGLLLRNLKGLGFKGLGFRVAVKELRIGYQNGYVYIYIYTCI